MKPSTKIDNDVQIYSTKQVITKITERDGKKNNKLKFTGQHACRYSVDSITRKWLYANLWYTEETFKRELVYDRTKMEFRVPVDQLSATKTNLLYKNIIHV